MATKQTANSDQHLVERGRARAGSNQKLADAVGCSSRMISLAIRGSQHLPEEVRRRLAAYLASGLPSEAPKILPGRQPIEYPEGGAMKYRLSPKERAGFLRLAERHKRGQTGVLAEAITRYLAEHRKALPSFTLRDESELIQVRTRLDESVIRSLNQRVQGQYDGSLTLRAAYIRAALAAHIAAAEKEGSQ